MGPSLKDPPQAEGPPGETVGQTLRQRPKARTWNAPQPHTAAKSAPSDRPRRPAPKKYAKGDPLGSPFFANAAGERIAPPTHCPAPLQEANRVEGSYGRYELRGKGSRSFPSTPVIYTPFALLYTPNAFRRRQITKKPSRRAKNRPEQASQITERRKGAPRKAKPCGPDRRPPEIPRPSGGPKDSKASPAGTSFQEHQGRSRRSHHQHDKK